MIEDCNLCKEKEETRPVDLKNGHTIAVCSLCYNRNWRVFAEQEKKAIRIRKVAKPRTVPVVASEYKGETMKQYFERMAKGIVNLSEINLDDLPKEKAVYAIFAQSEKTLKPINCRYVGETDNLDERIKAHFANNEQNECLQDFMQSAKTKLMTFELLPISNKQDRLEKEEEWIGIFEPSCNE